MDSLQQISRKLGLLPTNELRMVIAKIIVLELGT
jgi:hypothetical protein